MPKSPFLWSQSATYKYYYSMKMTKRRATRELKWGEKSLAYVSSNVAYEWNCAVTKPQTNAPTHVYVNDNGN